MIYHGDATTLNDVAANVNQVVTKLRPRKDQFDSIVVRGMSGVIVGSPVALRLKKPLVVVRKWGEKSHAQSEGSGQIINAQNIGDRWLFLDDFTLTGTTLKTCKRHLNRYGCEHVASFFYRDMQWRRAPCG